MCTCKHQVWGGNGTTIDHTKFDARLSTHLPLPQKTSRSWTSTRAAWRTWARSAMRRFQFNPLGRHFFCQTKLWGVARPGSGDTVRYCEKESESTGFQVTSVFFQFCRIRIGIWSGAKGSPGLGSLGQSGHQEVEEVFCRPARPLERRTSMGMNELSDSSSII